MNHHCRILAGICAWLILRGRGESQEKENPERVRGSAGFSTVYSMKLVDNNTLHKLSSFVKIAGNKNESDSNPSTLRRTRNPTGKH